MSAPTGLAFIGAGIFPREAYVPSLNHPDLSDRFTVQAVCSRSAATAESLAALFPNGPDVLTDEAALLARQDIAAVVLALPIPLMAGAVERALAAGKHVISEKPIAPDVATGRRLVDFYREGHDARVWMVAENWRYENAFVRAAEIIQRGDIGQPVMAHWAAYTGLPTDNKYYRTAWRRSGDIPGGFILDGGVHQIAALRLLLGEVTQVSAVVTQARADLPPADTVSASLWFESGAVGSYTRTYAVSAPWYGGLHIAGERGWLRVDRGEIELNVGDGPPQVIQTKRYDGVHEQLLAFADAIQAGKPHHNSPEEALRDVAVIEAMLRSSAEGVAVRLEQ